MMERAQNCLGEKNILRVAPPFRFEQLTILFSDMDIMKGLVCLHALILAAEAITNYGIQSAIGMNLPLFILT